MEKNRDKSLLEWLAKKNYRWIKKYPDGSVLWQESRPDDSMDVWALPGYTTEQLIEQYEKQETDKTAGEL